MKLQGIRWNGAQQRDAERQGHAATLLQGVKRTRPRPTGKFINHGDRHGRYLRTQSAREHRKKPICPLGSLSTSKKPWRRQKWRGKKKNKTRGDKRGGREASTRTGERREAAATTDGTRRGIRRHEEKTRGRRAEEEEEEEERKEEEEVIVVEDRKGGRMVDGWCCWVERRGEEDGRGERKRREGEKGGERKDTRGACVEARTRTAL